MRLASIPLQVANVAVVLLAPAIFLSVRSRLPERIPMHFGLDGQPTRYGSPDELWAIFLVMGVLYGILWFRLHAIATEWVAPPEAAERFEVLELERRRSLARIAEASILVANGVLMLVSFSAIAMGFMPGSGLPHWIPIGLVVLAVVGLGIVMVIWHRRFSRIEAEQRALPGAAIAAPPAHRWRAGGLIYYAPEDPAVIVPKRIGVGYTLNFARRRAWLLLAAILGVPLLVVGLASSLG